MPNIYHFYKAIKNIFCVVAIGLASFAMLHAQPGAAWLNVQQHGVVPYKDSISTTALQSLIDKCHANGGGTLYFPAGEYGSGQLYLRSRVSFYLEAGATLYASTNPAHYKPRSGAYVADNQTALPNEQALFYGDSVSHVGFYGKGRLHGQAKRVWEPLREVDMFIQKETENARRAGIPMERFYAVEPKIRLIYIHKAAHINVRDITLEESPDWTLHLGHTDNAVIDGITLLSSLSAGVNADGIDIDGCSNVRISNCHIATGDDAICLKSTNRFGEYRACENIVVNNCTLTSTSTALKIGTESHGDFRNIIFSNCVVTNTNRGISIVVRDGATVENVYFTNLIMDCNRKHFNWWGDGDPIRFILLKRTPQSRLGNIRNIFVQNVTATGMGTSLIQGYEGSPLQNIVLDNVRLTLLPESLADKRATDVLQIRQAEGVTLRHVSLGWQYKEREPLWRAALWAEKVNGLHLQWLQVKSPWQKGGWLGRQQVTNLQVDGNIPEASWMKPNNNKK